jgi:DUF2950 family protein
VAARAEAVVAAADAGVAEADVAAAGGVDRARDHSTITKVMEITMRVNRWNPRVRTGKWIDLLLALAAMMFVATAGAAAPAQTTYATPESAADALVQAVKRHDRNAILAVLGDVSDWISSGDKVADRAAGDGFVAAYEKKHAIQRDGDTARLVVGDDENAFAFPIVKSGDKWRFDTAAGKDELLARRIGENELDAIKVMQAIVDAQREYASADRNGDGVLSYAQKFASSPGKRDGLYWPAKAGEPMSPLGLLVATAAGEGYGKGSAEKGPRPFHGYYYRMLKGQGPAAEGGALDYVVKGREIGGFAVVAYPARYGNSGIMTFIVNHDGKVYQADLGPKTAEIARKMQRFDPGKAWTPVTAK